MVQKKATIILFLIIVSGSLIACGKNKNENNVNSILDENTTLEGSTYSVNNFKDASISVVKDSITNRSISVKVSYTGDNTGILGSWFSVEIYKDDQWCIIPYIDDNLAFHDMAYPIDETGFRIMDYDWNVMYQALPSGQYRIITRILDFIEPGNFKDYYLATEFKIE